LEQAVQSPIALRGPFVQSSARDAARATAAAPHEDALWRLEADAQLACGEVALATRDTAAARSAADGAQRAATRATMAVPERASNLDRLANALALAARSAAAADRAHAARLATQ